jgi:hypothetical protein
VTFIDGSLRVWILELFQQRSLSEALPAKGHRASCGSIYGGGACSASRPELPSLTCGFAKTSYVSVRLHGMVKGADTIGRGQGGAVIESSPHAAFGFVTCARDGCICWRGSIERLPADIGFDVVYCHDDDAEQVQRTLFARRTPAKMMI